MLGKPSKHYDISAESDLLKISMTREALAYFNRRVVGFWFIFLMMIAASAFVLDPLTKPAWWMILCLGTVGTLLGLVVLYLQWAGRECVFERAKNRISCEGQSLAKSTTSVKSASIKKKVRTES